MDESAIKVLSWAEEAMQQLRQARIDVENTRSAWLAAHSRCKVLKTAAARRDVTFKLDEYEAALARRRVLQEALKV